MSTDKVLELRRHGWSQNRIANELGISRLGVRGRLQPLTDERIEQFWRCVNFLGPLVRLELGCCWLWVGRMNNTGYGSYLFRGAHRISYEMAYGAIPEGLCCMHRCDVKLCVNPLHLEAGTQRQNVRDYFDRGV
jgi:hypothetical protein